MPQPSLPRSPALSLWRARLLAWPGTLMLLSVLAVLLGQQLHLGDGVGPRITAGSVAPALPEVRPTPQPLPGPGLLAGTPPEPLRLPRLHTEPKAGQVLWTAPHLPRTLALLGRRQTDGG
ncbi:hypothetical protein [Deinococcus hopiensis]|uniref:Uncharacterized protein n=1 Tax=Deinococcus hopiensis KR-140 TaxID=695939 RepID=A0A1W1VJE9_9DEIO|nr:hypothetical protein [Deinococcus hopiensis]SMB93505.1 hypothetical protein SAMN00790413_02012 [Deinococcus hopiensis KR-140]